MMEETNNTTTETNLKEQIVTAIKSVYDPEIPVDVYELGLIYEINIFPMNNVHVLMTLTSP
ncbi:MAG: metal-sulfur cluster biosynthetic enzyme, partial [Marinoscillum sp.]